MMLCGSFFPARCAKPRSNIKKNHFIQNFESGAYWGEDCLNGGKLRYNILVLKTSMLIRITAPQLRTLVDQFPRLESNMQILNTSINLTDKMNLNLAPTRGRSFLCGAETSRVSIWDAIPSCVAHFCHGLSDSGIY